MAINQAQPLNILTASELTDARDFLAEADILVTDVKSLFFTGVISRRRPAQGHSGSPGK